MLIIWSFYYFQQEKQAKRIENKKIKIEKENELNKQDEIDSKQVTVAETPSSARKRGAKRQHDSKNIAEAKPNKRSRKVKLTEPSILNVIDQEELEKRATKVIYLQVTFMTVTYQYIYKNRKNLKMKKQLKNSKVKKRYQISLKEEQ